MSDLSQQVRILNYTFSHHLRLAVICYFTTGKELHSSLSEAFVGKVLSKVAVRRLHFEWAA
jgi:hypothetical protein